MSQLRLSWDGRPSDPLAEHEDRIFRALENLVDAVGGLKEAAFVLDVQASVLSHSLRRRDRHPFRVEWVARLLEVAGRSAAGRMVARAYLEAQGALCGCEVLPARELSDAERLRALEDALQRHLGRGIVAALYQEAWGPNYPPHREGESGR